MTTTKSTKAIVEQLGSNANQNPPQSDQGHEQARKLFVKVDTFNVEGRTIGTRIVDMYHFGTRPWLQGHQWWAMHNGHTVEARPAEPEEVTEYMALQTAALAAKFNTEKAHVA